MNDININDSGIKSMLDDLGGFARSEMILKSCKKGAQYLKEKIQNSLVNKFPKAKTAHGKNKNTTMYEGIFVKTDKTLGEVAVKGTGNYLNPIFEGGTVDRYLKIRYKDKKGRTRIDHNTKGAYRGKIKPINFFNTTKERESDATLKVIQEDINNEINKLIK